MHTQKKAVWWKVVHYVHYFCYSLWISGDERNKAWGSSRWKTSIISQEVQTLTLSHTHTHWSTHAGHNSGYTQDFQFAIRLSMVNSPCSPPLSLVFDIKVPPCHKSQILYDILEIALSKMQSAKAASSADELLWLRKRQWLVSFATIGSIVGKAHRGCKEVTMQACIPYIKMDQHSWKLNYVCRTTYQNANFPLRWLCQSFLFLLESVIWSIKPLFYYSFIIITARTEGS